MSLSYKTIIDVGAHNGDDVDYYLKKEFKVIALEANPVLCNLMGERFVDYIKRGVLSIHNVAISNYTGQTKFYINREKTDWSSLHKASKATETEYDVHKVNVVTLRSIMEGVDNVHYIKLDIEGGELDALKSIDSSCKLPRFISIECNYDRTEIIDVLIGNGYTEFMLVRQGKDYLSRPKSPALEGSFCDYEFTSNHSGMFGMELEGEWLSASEFLDYKKAEFIEWDSSGHVESNPYGSGWYDIHARL